VQTAAAFAVETTITSPLLVCEKNVNSRATAIATARKSGIVNLRASIMGH
jgi:hypothetical protein